MTQGRTCGETQRIQGDADGTRDGLVPCEGVVEHGSRVCVYTGRVDFVYTPDVPKQDAKGRRAGVVIATNVRAAIFVLLAGLLTFTHDDLPRAAGTAVPQ